VNALLQIARAEDAAAARETSTPEVTQYRRYFLTACVSLLPCIASSGLSCCLVRCVIVSIRNLSIGLLGLCSVHANSYCGDESYYALSCLALCTALFFELWTLRWRNRIIELLLTCAVLCCAVLYRCVCPVVTGGISSPLRPSRVCPSTVPPHWSP
jgi:hypothetical protein